MLLGDVILGYIAELQIQLLRATNYFRHIQVGVAHIMNFPSCMQLMPLHIGSQVLM